MLLVKLSVFASFVSLLALPVTALAQTEQKAIVSGNDIGAMVLALFARFSGHCCIGVTVKTI